MREHTKKHPIEPSEAIVNICWGADEKKQRYVLSAGNMDALRKVVESMAEQSRMTVYGSPKAKAVAQASKGVSWRSLASKTGHIEPSDPQSEVAMTIRAYRKAQGMSQSRLAQLLGCQQANVSAIEKGKRAVGAAMAKKLAKIFEVDVALFL